MHVTHTATDEYRHDVAQTLQQRLVRRGVTSLARCHQQRKFVFLVRGHSLPIRALPVGTRRIFADWRAALDVHHILSSMNEVTDTMPSFTAPATVTFRFASCLEALRAATACSLPLASSLKTMPLSVTTA